MAGKHEALTGFVLFLTYQLKSGIEHEHWSLGNRDRFDYIGLPWFGFTLKCKESKWP